MSYELRFDRSLARNLGRIFRKQIDAALAIAHGAAEPNDTRVHALRKHLKKARAVLQLVRKPIGGNEFRREDRRLSDVARLVMELRDAEVRLQTVRQLENVTHRSRSYQEIERLLALELENFIAAYGGWEAQAIPLLERARVAVKKWSIHNYGRPQLHRAVQRTYKRGRKALAIARAHPTAASAHKLRKQVKLLGNQLRIVRPLNPLVLDRLSEELIKLDDLLGRVHDLSFLADRLRGERRKPDRGKQHEKLVAVIEKTQAQLQRKGTEMAEAVFAERASEFGSRIDQWFEDSQRGNASLIAGTPISA